MRIIVTGANGFLGREIVSQLRASGIPLRATDIGAVSVENGFEYIKADVIRLADLSRAFCGASIVIHAAGLAHVYSSGEKRAGSYKLVNEIGTANAVSVAAQLGVKHFILISSVSVYGQSTQGIYNEDTLCNPEGSYALSKHDAEQRAREIAQKERISLTILRLATLYGEGDPGNVGRVMRALDRGSFYWIGNGNNRKSLLYKRDAARACLAVATRPASGMKIYNVSAPPCTMREIVDGLAAALQKRPLPVRIPAHIALAAGKFFSCFPAKRLSGLHSTIKKWLAEDVYDTSRFEKDYGFHAQVDLIEGLTREVRWYRQRRENI